MRLFAALFPPQEAVEDLDAFLDVRRAAADFRWAQREQLHVTLAFLAEVAPWRLDELLERLARAAARRTPFEVAIAGGGAFPDAGRAKVIWAGLSLGSEAAATELERSASGARAAAAKSGIAVDGARFRPHLTVARLGVPREVSNWVRLLDAYSGPTWTASSVTLVQSHLGDGPRGRPRYEVLAELPLGAVPPGAVAPGAVPL
ncbi:RNA 2',3'-cyclic phosphodiesterase [Nocardioides sp. BP30]|uniref:RNA 2',3'-cyclic phosphodiesterase n=1 Tax=Nocardioides sp. BP30 TaxID=3036374 RepID=UPI0024698240|nr:RNA 2',3'-cyclic phosphodiesterase [Nocardioides sp. BP30]WGL52354.1 RNA 2',3'-cyclic phosphodiesterase [Nocardioides sp. BP30]